MFMFVKLSQYCSEDKIPPHEHLPKASKLLSVTELS